jgi:hypothetical protein
MKPAASKIAKTGTRNAKFQMGGMSKKINQAPSYARSQAKAEELYDNDPSVRTYTNEFTGERIPTGPMTREEYQKAAERAASVRAKAMGQGPTMKKGGAMKAKYKTGGMVNPNAKVSKQTTPGSRGVKSGVNPKAAASKVAKGRVGGTSKAPRGAMPKAQMGTTVGPRAMQTYTGTNPERPTGTPVQRKTEGQVKKLRGVAKLKANRINKRIKKG